MEESAETNKTSLKEGVRKEELKALSREELVGLVVKLEEDNAALARKAEEANRDSLTGLLNRKGFSESVLADIPHAKRADEPYTILFLDIDNLKQINDGLGHAKGDGILTAVADVLVQSTRASDKVARIGGDEFAVGLVNTDTAGAVVIVERINLLLSPLMKSSLPEGFSVGLSTGTSQVADDDSLSAMELFAKAMDEADRLMYEDKSNKPERSTGRK